MSIRLMSRVWEESPQKGGDLIVLLALADWANDEGHCWPSIPTLAKRARMSERNVQRVVDRLKDAGQIEKYEGGFISGQNRTNTYKVTPRQNATTPLTPAPPPGDADDTTPGDADVTPSRTASKEPSVEPEAASAADGEQQLFEAPPVKAAPVHSDGQPGDPNERIGMVWDHYVQVFGDRLRVKELTAPRERMLLKGLTAIAWDVELAKRAINGLKSYRSAHPDGSQDISLSVVFATGPHSKSNLTDQIEWWAQQAKEAVPTNASVQIPVDLVGVPSVTKGTILARRREVARMYDHPGSAEAKERGEVAVDWLKEHIGHQPKVVDGELRGWELVER